ncbi:MAG: hypothetical protein GJT30_00360 [Geobacter sp.]|nr:hypothetical protein [Geobacter sp.]
MRFFLALLLMFCLFCGWGTANAGDGASVVAIVNGAELTKAELNQEISKIIPLERSFHGGVSPEKMKEIEKKAMNVLVDMELQYQDALDKKMKLSKAELEMEIGTLVAKFPTLEEYEKAVASAGFSEKSMTRFVERNTLSKKINLKEVDDRINVTDVQVAKYYQENSTKYKKPEEYRASIILVKVPPSSTASQRAEYRKKIEDLLQKIQNGAVFADIAAAYSDDMTRIKGGDLGVMHAGQMEEEFEKQIKSMKIGEVSGVVESLKGFYLVKLDDKKEPRQIPFDEAKEKIKKQLTTQERERLFNEWMDGLRGKAKIIYPTAKG